MIYFDWMIRVYYFWTVYDLSVQRVTITIDDSYASLKWICLLHFTWGIYFPRSFYVFLAIFTSGKIDSDVVCLQFAVIMARFGKVNADEIT